MDEREFVIKETKKARGVRLSDAQWDAVKEKADSHNVRPSDVIRRAIDVYLGEGK